MVNKNRLNSFASNRNSEAASRFKSDARIHKPTDPSNKKYRSPMQEINDENLINYYEAEKNYWENRYIESQNQSTDFKIEIENLIKENIKLREDKEEFIIRVDQFNRKEMDHNNVCSQIDILVQSNNVLTNEVQEYSKINTMFQREKDEMERKMEA